MRFCSVNTLLTTNRSFVLTALGFVTRRLKTIVTIFVTIKVPICILVTNFVTIRSDRHPLEPLFVTISPKSLQSQRNNTFCGTMHVDIIQIVTVYVAIPICTAQIVTLSVTITFTPSCFRQQFALSPKQSITKFRQSEVEVRVWFVSVVQFDTPQYRTPPHHYLLSQYPLMPA